MAVRTRTHSETGASAPLAEKIAAAVTLLQRIATDHAPATFASSLGAEDMVLTDLINEHAPAIEIFTLDTGRLHAETYGLLARITEHYRVPVRVVYPQTEAIERYVNEHGINAFYESVSLRKGCCEIRKVEPLRRALAGKRAWITGRRRTQSMTREQLVEQEHDLIHGMEKFNPLATWDKRDVWAYLQAYQVPYNELHDRGFPSIGCAPCTRALTPGEDIRAGRWWWEDPELKECGLHSKQTKASPGRS